ncbi:MAG: hypothetical protein QNJ69_03590 [Gammaproteobacteria bacterium]|nr:hypothetical protein [Gammaproteobacteria bacterium]
MKIIQLSKTGLILGALYIAIIIVCVIWAQFISDPKGKFIVLQLPVVMQHGLLLAIDGSWILRGMAWPGIYLLLGIPMLALLVFLGNIIEDLVKKYISNYSVDERP